MEDNNGDDTDKFIEELEKEAKEDQKKATENIYKYFNRIHDKLFTLNNILIGFYYYFSKIEDEMPLMSMVVPLLNLIYFIYIEYYNMETSRLEANKDTMPIEDVKRKLFPRYDKVTRFSLYSIISTSIVLLVLLYNIIF